MKVAGGKPAAGAPTGVRREGITNSWDSDEIGIAATAVGLTGIAAFQAAGIGDP